MILFFVNFWLNPFAVNILLVLEQNLDLMNRTWFGNRQLHVSNIYHHIPGPRYIIARNSTSTMKTVTQWGRMYIL